MTGGEEKENTDDNLHLAILNCINKKTSFLLFISLLLLLISFTSSLFFLYHYFCYSSLYIDKNTCISPLLTNLHTLKKSKNYNLMNSSKSTNKNNSKNNVVTAKESFHGYIETTRDSLLLFEACKRGIIPRISRRLQDKERHLIRSGSIFCFDEKESGIKRWTDGLIWSPSRILGNFLIYRELDDKKFVRSNSTDHSIMQRQHQHDNGVGATTTTTTTNNNMDHDDDVTMRSRSSSLSSCNSSIAAMASGYVGAPDLLRRQREKALLGSLKTSYKFKKNGLIKKSMSLIVDGVQQHIISYYSKEDVLSCRLKTPSSLVELSSLEVSPSLRLRQNFRIPNFLSEENTSDDR